MIAYALKILDRIKEDGPINPDPDIQDSLDVACESLRNCTEYPIDAVLALTFKHRSTWTKEGEDRWIMGLIAEVGELANSLQGKHEYSPDYELIQIAAIALNWLRLRKKRTV